MACINHPDKETTIHCLECGTPLCDQCAVPQHSDAYLCRKCVTRSAAQDTVQDISIRQHHSIQREFANEAKRKKNVLMVRLALLSMVILIIGLNFYLYFQHSPPLWSAEVSAEQPAVTMILLDAALQDYADDHQGKFPEYLDKLQDKYIDAEDFRPHDLNYIEYTRTSPYSYELRFLNSNGGVGSNLVLTEMDSDETRQ